MKRTRYLTGPTKAVIYLRIASHVIFRYALRPSFFKTPVDYFRFLRRAATLLLIFRHNKVVRVFNGYKLHLYLPAYPSPAFFHALESKLLKTPPGPTTVVYSMTKACSYHCPHCYQARDGGRDLDETILLDTARKLVDKGVAMFDIEGGEPFLRFKRLLNLVKALDDRCEIWINTNGAHMEPGMLENLKEAGLFGIMVSIHSPDPSKHDAFTGVPGSFDAAVKILKTCRSMNRVAAFNSVPTQEEIEQGGLDALMDLARELDCQYVQLIHPKPAGKWMGRENGMQREKEIINEIRKAHLDYNSLRKPDHPSLAAQAFEEGEKVLGCTAGAVDRFYLNAYGEVQPCEFLNISFGNVKDEPFETIYDRMRSYFKIPCSNWLCCTQAQAISKFMAKHDIQRTPLPWEFSREL
ncbi:MAG: radical SAM protein, partial [Planctomycetes bacterium]|nr:radical SAM protein [Planctomycetota bacterium]